MTQTSTNRINAISQEIQKTMMSSPAISIDQARAKVFATCTPVEVGDYLAAEAADDRRWAAASDTRGTY